MRIKTRLLLVISLMFNLYLLNGQIIITSGEEVTAEDLVESILEEGVQYFNVQYQGADSAKGIYSNGDPSFLGKTKGVILSSGYAVDFAGPNNQTSLTGNFLLPGDSSLTAMGSGTTFDASILYFSFIPESDSIKIKYVFGSEEYPDLYNNFYDRVAIFLSGPNPNGGNFESKNIAVVPESDPEQHISVGSINNETNEEYYVDNADGLTLQYDGFTIVLTAKVGVVPCEIYNVKIVVADAGDMVVDSGVSLEENSIQFPGIEIEQILTPAGISDNLVEGCVEMDIVFRLPNASYAPTTVEFEITEGPGYAQTPEDYTDENGNEILPYVTFEEGEDSVSIHIVPILDYIPENPEMIQLIIANTLGCEIRYDTIDLLIQDYRLMIDTISPSTVVCECMDSINLWVQVFNGISPYSYLWEPGGYITDTILVDPDTTTIYTVSYTDMCLETGTASTTVTVFPFADLESFYFEAVLNPGLPFDVYGEILEDTVVILFPPGTNLNGLVASLTTSMEWMWIIVDSVYQEPGVTPNDFTNPVVYDIWSPGGHHSLWTVIAEVEVGHNEFSENEIQIFPNPVKDQLNILNANGYKVSLVSNLGVEVYSNTIKNKKQTIDINHLEPGIYYLKFDYEEGEFVKKVVIEK